MVKEFNKLEEIQEYYDKPSNTYIFKVKNSNRYIDFIVFKFHLDIDANIDAFNIGADDIEVIEDIKAGDINVKNIDACFIMANDIDAENIRALDIIATSDIRAIDITASDINAFDIKARDISYGAVCFAYNNIKCRSIKGRRKNAKHFVLDGKLEVEDE